MPPNLVQTRVGRSVVSRAALRDASRTASSLEPRPKTRREPRPASHLSGPATRLRPVRSWFAPGNCPALETAGSLPRHLSGLGTRGVSPAETVHSSPRLVLRPKCLRSRSCSFDLLGFLFSRGVLLYQSQKICNCLNQNKQFRHFTFVSANQIHRANMHFGKIPKKMVKFSKISAKCWQILQFFVKNQQKNQNF